MAKENFHGAFVFRNQEHGILSSTYFNTSTPKPYSETAILIENRDAGDPFVGTFDTIWLEANQHLYKDLKIQRGFNNFQDAYHLEWRNKDTNDIEWEGLGNLENGLLIGCYWKHKE